MPNNHYSGSDASRPEMGIMGIMNRARGIHIVENGFHVRMMFLFLGLFLSIVNLPIASGQIDPLPPPGNPDPPIIASPPPPSASLDPPPSGGLSSPPLAPPFFPPPPSNTQLSTGGDTWNESEKAGVVIASIAALLQVAVVAFLLIKRHQMLTTVEYDDIEDLEYDTPPDSNFRDIESA